MCLTDLHQHVLRFGELPACLRWSFIFACAYVWRFQHISTMLDADQIINGTTAQTVPGQGVAM